MGIARVTETAALCRKRYELERRIAATGHRWPDPARVRVGQPMSGWECIIHLWTWLDGRDDPSGRLYDVEASDVEREAHWDGAPGVLWNALLQSGWIEHDGEGFRWHDYYAINGRTIADRVKKRALRQPAPTPPPPPAPPAPPEERGAGAPITRSPRKEHPPSARAHATGAPKGDATGDGRGDAEGDGRGAYGYGFSEVAVEDARAAPPELEPGSDADPLEVAVRERLRFRGRTPAAAAALRDAVADLRAAGLDDAAILASAGPLPEMPFDWRNRVMAARATTARRSSSQRAAPAARHAPAAPAVPCAECARHGPPQGASAPLLAHAWPEGTEGVPSHQQAPIAEPLCAPHRDRALAPRRLRAL